MSTAMTVTEFLAVRREVANALKKDSSTQEPTRIRQAENLMEQGFINIRVVLAASPVQDFTNDEEAVEVVSTVAGLEASEHQRRMAEEA